MAVALGCSGPILRQQGPEAVAELAEPETRLVGEFTRPFGMHPIKLEAISLVTGLKGTGEDPPPSPQRAAVLEEMQRRNVAQPNQVLASPDTAIVLVRGFLRPGIQKGDAFDVEVKTPSWSQTTSLRGGWLLESRLSELEVLGNSAHRGHLMAFAEGPVMVDPATDGEDGKASQTRGRVLGGATALKSRPLGLLIDEAQQSVRTSQQIGVSINKRFYMHVHGSKQGVANPKTDEFIELIVHPRYKNNIGRYLRVLRSIAYRETAAARTARLSLLERQLLDPVTSATAALRLEAIGAEGVDALKRGIAAEDPEVRFYAAEALAYLDDTDAVAPLAEAARNEPAFRLLALAALSSMDDPLARDELLQMLHLASAETRYGAFRALTEMNARDPAIRGEHLAGQFHYHVLDSSGPPMIHVTRNRRPEIVLFGRSHTLQPPFLLEGGNSVLVNAPSAGDVTVSRFAVGEADQKRRTSGDVDDVIRTMVELGASYPDVVQVLQQAKEKGALASRFKVDALPDVGRHYDRGDGDAGDEERTEDVSRWAELFWPWKR